MRGQTECGRLSGATPADAETHFTTLGMTLRYDDDLLEAAVFLCASGRRPGVPRAQIARFHRERERLYAIPDPDERNTAFFQLHLAWFREWGLEDTLGRFLAEFPLLSPALHTLAFRKARGRQEEGAELYVNLAPDAPPAVDRAASFSPDQPAAAKPKDLARGPAVVRTGVIALRAERFADDAALAALLRHELTHLQDMVDPAFGYSPELRRAGADPACQRLARQRYRLLWDITIDGRLARRPNGAQTLRETHRAAFDRAFGFWPEARRQAVFEELWTNPAPRHQRLEQLAADPRDLAQAARPLPGAPCPLCGFPTFTWADLAGVNARVLAAIRAEFPDWAPERGACARCVEAYQAVQKFPHPPTLCA